MATQYEYTAVSDEEAWKALSEETHAMLLRMPFSLACVLCDGGDGISSVNEAIRLGWRNIEYDDGDGWNFLGVCPDCAPPWIGILKREG